MFGDLTLFSLSLTHILQWLFCSETDWAFTSMSNIALNSNPSNKKEHAIETFIKWLIYNNTITNIELVIVPRVKDFWTDKQDNMIWIMQVWCKIITCTKGTSCHLLIWNPETNSGWVNYNSSNLSLKFHHVGAYINDPKCQES